MVRIANLTIYEAIISLLEEAPGIKLEHVKAHGAPRNNHSGQELNRVMSMLINWPKGILITGKIEKPRHQNNVS